MKKSVLSKEQPVSFVTAEKNHLNFKTGFILNLVFKAVLVFSVFSLISSVFYGRSELTKNAFTVFLDSVNSGDIVFFDYGKYDLKPEGKEILDKIAQQMNDDLTIKLSIKGHTDDRGSNEFNKILSLKRAEEVRNYLVSVGIDGSRLSAEGYGEEFPAAENTDEPSRKKNRRVEFSFISDKPVRYEGKNAEREKTRFTYAQPTLRNNLSNSVFKILSRDEINAEISLRDSTGDVVTGVNEDDITAVLKWDNNGKIDSTEGYPRLIPINDKKKLAFTLTMDYSGSMYDDENNLKNIPKSSKIMAMEKSVKKFIDLMENNMYCKIIKFGDKVIVTSGFSGSKQFLNQLVDAGSMPMGGTALYSSIFTALSDTSYQSNPVFMKTVIAFTDGMENASSRLTLDSIYRKSDVTNTKIYTIGWFDFTGKYKPTENELIRGKSDLLNIARNTGGFFYRADDAGDLEKIYSKIFEQILNAYNVSIVWNSSKLPPKGTQVKAELKINVKGSTRILYKNYVME